MFKNVFERAQGRDFLFSGLASVLSPKYAPEGFTRIFGISRLFLFGAFS